MRVYFDSSAWAKLYLRETGTDRALEVTGWADEMVVSILCVPEVISALSRRRREGTVSQEEYQHLRAAVQKDVASVYVCDLTAEVLQRSLGVMEACPLRALDALHVASAIECQSDIFFSCDQRQLEAAKAHRLRTLST